MRDGEHRRARGGVCAALVVSCAALGFAPGAFGQDERQEDLRLVSGGTGLLGYGVAVSGTRVYAGAPWDPASDHESAVIVFDAASGRQLGKIYSSDTQYEDLFGATVAVSGDLLLVGAPYDSDDGEDTGAAYLFSIETGELLFRFAAPVPQSDSGFAASLALDGQYAVVGSAVRDAGTGAVYVFDTGTGQLLSKLTASDADVENYLGTSVAVRASDGVVLAGAPLADGAQVVSGAVYAFNAATGSQLAKFVASNGAPGDYFGISVSLDGDRFAVGATGVGNDEGAVYLFDANTGQELALVASPTPISNSSFGQQVALSDGFLVAGQTSDYWYNPTIGRAHAISLATMTPVLEMRQSDPPRGYPYGDRDSFAKNFAIDGPFCVFGTPEHNGSEGAAYLYSFAPRMLGMSGSVVADAGDPPVHFEVTAEHAAEYQWRMDGADLQDDALHSGTQTRRMTVHPRLATEGSYDVLMSNSLGDSVSPALVLGVRQPCPADINGDGLTDVRDVLAFLNLWSAGCP